MNDTPAPAGNGRATGLGTFAGVFTPSFLTIIGVIFFMRLGFVTGHAGLLEVLLIIALANTVSVLTSVSLAAIATNLRVKVGGVYYIISRTLGPQFGGAIGIVLYLAQSVSIAFYCIGFGEVVAGLVPGAGPVLARVVAAVAVALLFVPAWMGADVAVRFQFVVMGVLACALLAFFAGGLSRFDGGVLLANLHPPEGALRFWALFAIFFPAVTGFTQGVNMSGDLRDPDRSILHGTFWAVGLTCVIYLAAAVVFAGTLASGTLMHDYAAMKRIAPAGFLVDAGVIAATLSSAMASFLGGPRVLQSLAADRVVPALQPFARGVGPAANPRRGVVLSGAIALGTIALGDLNVVAPVVTMFFLITYGLLNYATYFEAQGMSPSFRPRFRWYHPRASLVGWVACLAAMFAINPAAGIVALGVLLLLYRYLQRTAGPSRWADSRRAHHLQHVRRHLLAAAAEPGHHRDWRPQLLVFSDDRHRRQRLLQCAAWLEGGSGVTTAVRIIEGEGLQGVRDRRDAEAQLGADIAAQGIEAFPLVVVGSDVDSVYWALLQASGIGPLRANTILVNWMEEMSRGIAAIRHLRYGRNLRAAQRLGCNIAVLAAQGDAAWDALQALPPQERRIDVWWRGDATSRLVLLLAHLLTRSEQWDGARIRVLDCAAQDVAVQDGVSMGTLLQDVRIQAEVRHCLSAAPVELCRESHDAAIALVPFRLVDTQVRAFDGTSIEPVLQALPVAVLVLAAEDIDLSAEPEEGAAAEAAALRDGLNAAGQRLRDARAMATQAGRELERAQEALARARSAGTDAEEAAQCVRDLQRAQDAAAEADRRVAKAAARLELASREAASDGEPGVGHPGE